MFATITTLFIDLSLHSIILVKPESLDVLGPVLAKYKIAQESNRILYVDFTSVVDYMWLLRAACECLVALNKRALLYLAAAVSDFYVPSDQMVCFNLNWEMPWRHAYCFCIDYYHVCMCSQRIKCNRDTEHRRYPCNWCRRCWLLWSACGCRKHLSSHSNWRPMKICWLPNRVIVSINISIRWVKFQSSPCTFDIKL